MITKLCQGCGEVYEHDDPSPLLAKPYKEMTLYCGHHFNHAGWRQVVGRAAALGVAGQGQKGDNTDG